MIDSKPSEYRLLISVSLVSVIAIAGVIWAILSNRPAPAPPPEIDIPVQLGVESAIAVEAEVGPEPEPETPAVVLPPLDESDDLIREGLIDLTPHAGVGAWVVSNELVRKFVTLVDNVSRGQVARESVLPLAPRDALVAEAQSETSFLMHPRSYRRYNRVADLVASVDARLAADFYYLLRPLFQEAYEELGYGDRRFDDVAFQAIDRLLAAPVITDDIRLVRPVVMYEYEDQRLESLSALQKQMLRMGPRNTRLIQRKVKELSSELGNRLKDG